MSRKISIRREDRSTSIVHFSNSHYRPKVDSIKQYLKMCVGMHNCLGADISRIEKGEIIIRYDPKIHSFWTKHRVEKDLKKIVSSYA